MRQNTKLASLSEINRRVKDSLREMPDSQLTTCALLRGVYGAVLIFVLPCPMSASDQVCQLPANGAGLSILGAPPTIAEMHMNEAPNASGKVQGVLHIFLRNDGPTQIKQLCETALLNNDNDSPQQVEIALSKQGQDEVNLDFKDSPYCFDIQPMNAFEEKPMGLYVRTTRSLVPLSGAINLETTVYSQEKTSTEPQGGVPKPADALSKPAVVFHTCVSSSKPISRSVLLLPSRTPGWLYLPLLGALIGATGYFSFSLKNLRRWSGARVAGPQWNFGTSFATNFTAGTGLVTILLGGSLITDALHYMTKLNYTTVGILFASLLLLAPAIFSFFSSPEQRSTADGENNTVYLGGLKLFLLTAAIMVGAFTGQLIVVCMAIAEIQYRGYIDCVTMSIFMLVLLAAGIGALVYAYRGAHSYLELLEFEGHKHEHLESIMQQFALHLCPSEADLAPPTELTNEERETFTRMLQRHGPEAPKWNMF